MAKRGRPRIRPDCDKAFFGDHVVHNRVIARRGHYHLASEPTRVNDKGRPVALCPIGYTEKYGFLTCSQAKLKGLCDKENISGISPDDKNSIIARIGVRV